MNPRFVQSSTSRPSIEWENAPLLRSRGRSRAHPLLPAIIAAFLVGLAVGVIF